MFFNMKKELSYALNYALNKGFQIHPDAFKILEDVDVKKLEKIIKEIVREKAKQKLFQINQDDLELYLGIKEDSTIQSEVKILDQREMMLSPNNLAVFDPGNIMHTGGWVKSGLRVNLQIQIRFLD